MAKEPAAGKDWKDCKTCGTIPAASSEFVKGGESDGPGLPASSLKLEIVGAPYFDDSTSGSNSCTKRCPECGSVFRWANEYEYLVNGSEDDTTLVRLGPEEGAKAEAEALHRAEVQKKLFQVEGTRRMHLLKTSTVAGVIDEAAGYLDHGQICHKEDITFAIPALVGALARHGHKSKNCNPGQRLFWVLSGYTWKSKEHAKRVLNALEAFVDKPHPPEIDELIAQCEKKHDGC
jgi:hypothetical protein